MGAKLTSLDVDIKGAQFTLSDFSSTSLSWKIHYSNSFWGYDVGKHFPSFSGAINIDPVHYIVQTGVGQAVQQYRARSTNHVDQCMARNFEGC